MSTYSMYAETKKSNFLFLLLTVRDFSLSITALELYDLTKASCIDIELVLHGLSDRLKHLSLTFRGLLRASDKQSIQDGIDSLSELVSLELVYKGRRSWPPPAYVDLFALSDLPRLRVRLQTHNLTQKYIKIDFRCSVDLKISQKLKLDNVCFWSMAWKDIAENITELSIRNTNIMYHPLGKLPLFKSLKSLHIDVVGCASQPTSLLYLEELKSLPQRPDKLCLAGFNLSKGQILFAVELALSALASRKIRVRPAIVKLDITWINDGKLLRIQSTTRYKDTLTRYFDLVDKEAPETALD